MEAEYNCPWRTARVARLVRREAAYYAGVQEFNAKSRNIKVIFINQFGFDRFSCGYRHARRYGIYGHPQGQRCRVRAKYL